MQSFPYTITLGIRPLDETGKFRDDFASGDESNF